MKYVFIINPLAGSGESITKIKADIANSGKSELCEIIETKCVGDGTTIVNEWCESHPDEEVRFIACGGDGTISEVFNGAIGKENVSVTCYPAGSGNDFVKSFGGMENFTNVERLINAPTQKLDLLKVGDRYSNNCTNFGFDTTVAITVNEDRAKNGHGSKNSYTKGIIKALVTSMKTKCTVIADGEVLNPDGEILLCTLGNGQYVGGSFKCAPRAKTNDGLIEVCLFKPISRFRFPKILPVYTDGKHLDDASLKDVCIYRQAKKVEIKATPGFAYSLDGEIIYEENFTVEIAPGLLDFAVPEY